ncbi:MAG: hypothetical protein ACI8QS_003366 [Planctomycetota bacterium]|jgi:hypothetical protein
MRNKQKGCRRMRAALMRVADECREGGIELEERFALDLHLEGCADCRALHEELALFGEGAARLTARAETAGNRLDLDGALGRLENALDAAPLDVPVADSLIGPLMGSLAGSLEDGHVNEIGAFRRSFSLLGPLLVAAASIAACATLFFWWQRTPSEKDTSSTPSEFVADLDGNTGEAVEMPVGRSTDGVLGRSTDGVLGQSTDGVLGQSTDGAADSVGQLPDEEQARIEATERLVQALACAFPGDEERTPAAELLAAGEVDRELSDLAASGWPLVRMAEESLRGENGQAAVRYLGVRGDSMSAARISALLRNEDRAAACVDALGGLARRGVSGGVAGLNRALKISGQARSAVEHLGRAPFAESAQVLATALESSVARTGLARGDAGAGTPEALILSALGSVGPAAVPSLFQLAEKAQRRGAGLPHVGEILGTLVGIEGHGAILAQQLTRDQGSELAFLTVQTSGDPRLLYWLEERASSTRSSDDAMAVLAEMPGIEVIDGLARLARRDRVATPVIDACLARVLALDAERAARWIEGRDEELRGQARSQDPEARFEFEAFAEIVLASASPNTGPALVALTSARALPLDERVWAALALAKVGSEGDLVLLMDHIKGASEQSDFEARLLAAQLLSTQGVLGGEAARECLLALGVTNLDDVLVELNRATERSSLAVEVHRVARALDDRRGAGLAQLQRRNSQ